mgnify:FL=1
MNVKNVKVREESLKMEQYSRAGIVLTAVKWISILKI